MQSAAEKKNPKGSPVEAIPALSLGDLSVWSEKIAGNDPHAGERRRFLERTRALRDHLREQAERAMQAARNAGNAP